MAEPDSPQRSSLGVTPLMAASPSASYSITVRLEIRNEPGMLGRVALAIGEAGGDIQ